MNKRIRLLAEQAEKYADDNFRGEPTWSEAFETKFAELIIKQCAKSLWTEECHNSDLALEEFEKNSAKIKEHFGVEE
jgi:hypothetical protein